MKFDFDIDKFIIESNKIEGIFETCEKSSFMKGQRAAVEYILRRANNFKDMEYQKLRERGIKIKFIYKIHELLMENLLAPEHCGKVRKCMVYIGNHIPPKPNEIKPLMKKLKDRMNLQSSDPLQCHYEFETIHPFIDGNGRTGRLLLFAQELIWHGRPKTLITYEGRQEYYEALRSYQLEKELYKRIGDLV